jgi:ABC-type branched-subunit amino acid transport system substrate-binding protein
MQYDVFISYSTNDRLIAETILNALKRRGITCWIAPDSIAAGASWREAIVDGLEQSRVMLVVLS